MHGCNRISELPEHLLTQILSFLRTKDSVKTSVLSSRWKNLWLNVPGLDLDCSDFSYEEDQVLLSFIDRFLEFNPELCLQKLKVKSKCVQIGGLAERIRTAINRGVQHLDVESITGYRESGGFFYRFIEIMPLDLYTSKTLVSFKLSSSGVDVPGFVSMPCLKVLHLLEIQQHMNLEKLFLGCPVLEELILMRYMYDECPVTRVTSRSLKRLCVPLRQWRFFRARVESTLEIDAPGLEYLSLKEDNFDRYVVKNLTSLFMIDLDIIFRVKFDMLFDPEDMSYRNQIRDFLTGISSVRHMIISQRTVEALHLYSKGGPIPKLNNLFRLEAVFPCDLLLFLPAFLECVPNLKHLILKVDYIEEIEVFKLIDVPRCLLSTLEWVEIKGIYEWKK